MEKNEDMKDQACEVKEAVDTMGVNAVAEQSYDSWILGINAELEILHDRTIQSRTAQLDSINLLSNCETEQRGVIAALTEIVTKLRAKTMVMNNEVSELGYSVRYRDTAYTKVNKALSEVSAIFDVSERKLNEIAEIMAQALEKDNRPRMAHLTALREIREIMLQPNDV